MPEKSGFFNANETSDGVYDKSYDAEDFAQYFATFIGSGVFVNPSDQLKVVPKTGLTVTVKAGKAFIDGYWYELDEDMDITLNANGTSGTINDVIVCTLNKSTRSINTVKKESVSSTLPVNNGTTHELILAIVSVGVGVSSLTAANITDTRPDSTYCGYVGALVEQVDFGNLFDQMESQFNAWFDEMKDQLSTDAAGNLQAQIDKTYKLERGTALQSGVDLNTITSVGNYYSNGESHGNSPVDSVGYTLKVEELSGDGQLIQKAILSDGKSYVRTYNSSEWTEWKLSNMNGFINLGSFMPFQNNSVTKSFTPEQLGVSSLSGVFVDCIMIRDAMYNDYEENSVRRSSTQTYVSGCRVYDNALRVTVTRPSSGQGIVYVLVRLSEVNIISEVAG